MIVTFLEAMGYIKREFKGIVTVMIVVIFCTACGTECLEHQPSVTGDESKEQSVNLKKADILDISEPHYDEYYAFLQGEYSEDNEAVMGSNLCYGSSMAEGDGAVYTLDIGMYGGKPMGEDECYNIYRQREGEWEVYISHPSYTADVNSISNVVYLVG